MFRLLPVQILLAAAGSVNGIVSSYFASNYVGLDAMSAVGLYGPVSMMIGAVSTVLSGGSAIICGRYLGQNEQGKLQKVFSLDLFLTALTAVLFTAVLLAMGMFDLTGIFTQDMSIRPAFNRYLLGQAIGVIPMMVGNQLPMFLAMENKGRRALNASLVYIAVNLALNILFVQTMHMEAFGLALASSLGMWVFMFAEIGHFLSKESNLKITFADIAWKEWTVVLLIGFPGAATYIYQTFRGLAVNRLLEMTAGSAGLSAFAAANNLLGIFWAIPAGMQAVSSLLISVSIGEEDRESLTNVMRGMFRYYVPVMCGVIACIIALAVPLTYIFFKDPSQDVFRYMVSGLRILPLCMPLSIIKMHFTVYGQAADRNGFVNVLSLLDGLICVAGYSWLLKDILGMKSVYAANVLNGVTTTLYIIAYAWFRKKHLPRNMEELMAIPDSFGVPESDRIDVVVQTEDDVVRVSEQIENFCLQKGADKKRSYYAGLAMEEMAGNVVSHGFTKDKKTHSVEMRAVWKEDTVILRVRDDCIPFDPKERAGMLDDADPSRNIGIRMIYGMMQDIRYQYLLGMNVLTVRI